MERAVDGESKSFREKRSRTSLLFDGGQFAAVKAGKQTVSESTEVSRFARSKVVEVWLYGRPNTDQLRQKYFRNFTVQFCSIMQANRLRSTGSRLLCGIKFGLQQFRGFAQQDPGEYPVEPEPPVPSTVL